MSAIECTVPALRTWFNASAAHFLVTYNATLATHVGTFAENARVRPPPPSGGFWLEEDARRMSATCAETADGCPCAAYRLDGENATAWVPSPELGWIPWTSCVPALSDPDVFRTAPPVAYVGYGPASSTRGWGYRARGGCTQALLVVSTSDAAAAAPTFTFGDPSAWLSQSMSWDTNTTLARAPPSGVSLIGDAIAYPVRVRSQMRPVGTRWVGRLWANASASTPLRVDEARVFADECAPACECVAIFAPSCGACTPTTLPFEMQTFSADGGWIGYSAAFDCTVNGGALDVRWALGDARGGARSISSNFEDPSPRVTPNSVEFAMRLVSLDAVRVAGAEAIGDVPIGPDVDGNATWSETLAFVAQSSRKTDVVQAPFFAIIAVGPGDSDGSTCGLLSSNVLGAQVFAYDDEALERANLTISDRVLFEAAATLFGGSALVTAGQAWTDDGGALFAFVNRFDLPLVPDLRYVACAVLFSVPDAARSVNGSYPVYVTRTAALLDSDSADDPSTFVVGGVRYWVPAVPRSTGGARCFQSTSCTLSAPMEAPIATTSYLMASPTYRTPEPRLEPQRSAWDVLDSVAVALALVSIVGVWAAVAFLRPPPVVNTQPKLIGDLAACTCTPA